MSGSDSTVKGTRKATAANTPANALDFLVERKIKDMVSTSDLAIVEEAEQPGTEGPAGFASATPLVAQLDAWDEVVAPATLRRLRAFRLQAGDCAVVLDPQPGDKCLAVFQKRDSSVVTPETTEPVQPGSFRAFDQADGVVFPSVQGRAPKAWLHLKPNRDVELSTDSASVVISVRESGDIEISTASGSATIRATEKIVLDAPVVEVAGRIRQTGARSGEASSFSGGFSNEGGTITSNGVTLETHVHGGVQTGTGSTGAPS